MHAFLRSTRCPRISLSRMYGTEIPASALNKWRIRGTPAPKSLFDDDGPVDLTEPEDDEAEPQLDRKTAPLHGRRPPSDPTPIEYVRHRETMRKAFADGWNPPRKISREAMDGLRELHRIDPDRFSTPVLADKFKISPEAVRRILKSRWSAPDEKKVKLVEKEREAYQSFVTGNRRKEKAEAELVLSSKRDRSDRNHAHGASTRDRFTFE